MTSPSCPLITESSCLRRHDWSRRTFPASLSGIVGGAVMAVGSFKLAHGQWGALVAVIVGAVFLWSAAKMCFNRWEITITPEEVCVYHGPLAWRRRWRIARNAKQQLLRVDRPGGYAWYLRDGQDDCLVTTSKRGNGPNTGAMDQALLAALGIEKGDLITRDWVAYEGECQANATRQGTFVTSDEVRWRWWNRKQLLPCLFLVAFAGMGGTITGSLLLPSLRHGLPQKGFDWFAITLLAFIFCLFGIFPLLAALSNILNTTTVRIQFDDLIITTYPLGRRKRFHLPDIAWVETITEKSCEASLRHVLRAWTHEGLGIEIMKAEENTPSLAGIGRTRALIEQWLKTNGSQQPSGDAQAPKKVRGRIQYDVKTKLIFGGFGLFLALFMAIGLFVAGMGAWKMGLRGAWHHDWTTVQATVTEHRIEAPEANGKNSQWQAQIHCRYDLGGEVKNTWIKGDPDADYHHATTIVSGHPVGSMCALRVNPKTLNEVEMPGTNLEQGWVLLGVGLVFFIGALTLLFGIWRNARQPVDNPEEKSSGAWVAFLFCTVALLLGSLFLWMSLIHPLFGHLRSRDWQLAPCTVESTRMIAHSNKGRTSYTADILYRYQWHDQTHRANRLDFTGGHTAPATDADYPAGKQMQCWINPSDPSEATLTRTWWAGGSTWVFVLGGALMFLLGVTGTGALLWGRLRKEMRRK